MGAYTARVVSVAHRVALKAFDWLTDAGSVVLALVIVACEAAFFWGRI